MSPARLSAPKALRMLTAFVPVLSESSALGADRYFDYRIENYAEALSDAPVDHVIDTLGETAKLLSGWSYPFNIKLVYVYYRCATRMA